MKYSVVFLRREVPDDSQKAPWSVRVEEWLEAQAKRGWRVVTCVGDNILLLENGPVPGDYIPESSGMASDALSEDSLANESLPDDVEVYCNPIHDILDAAGIEKGDLKIRVEALINSLSSTPVLEDHTQWLADMMMEMIVMWEDQPDIGAFADAFSNSLWHDRAAVLMSKLVSEKTVRFGERYSRHAPLQSTPKTESSHLYEMYNRRFNYTPPQFRIGQRVEVNVGNSPSGEGEVVSIMLSNEVPPKGWAEEYYGMDHKDKGFKGASGPTKNTRVVARRVDGGSYVVVPLNYGTRNCLKPLDFPNVQQSSVAPVPEGPLAKADMSAVECLPSVPGEIEHTMNVDHLMSEEDHDVQSGDAGEFCAGCGNELLDGTKCIHCGHDWAKET